MTDSVLQVNLIKNKGGSATGITIDNSNADVTMNRPLTASSGIANAGTITAGTIGSGVTFPTGMIVDQTIIKYAFGSNASYAHANTTMRVATRKSSSDSAVENINVNAGHTYIYEYVGFAQAYSGATIQRVIQVSLYDDDTTKSQQGSTLNGRLATQYLGRELNANGSTFATSQGNFKIP